MTLGDVIAEYRRTHGLSMAKFAEMSGISKGYISMLERNKTSRGEEPSPTIDVYRNVASAIGIDFDALIRMVDGQITLETGLPHNILPRPSFVKKPRLGTIACGKPILAVEEAEEFDEVPDWVECDFTLRCKGDSMINARIYDGDTVYIRSQPEVENGEIAAVRVDDEATLKRVMLYPDKIVLEAANPMYEPLVYRGEEMNDVQIMGKAIAFTSMIR